MGRKGGVSIRQWRKGHCPVCKCVPCENSADCRKWRGQQSYNIRKSITVQEAPKPKKAKLSWGQKRKIKQDAMNSYRAKHPTASDGKIKREGNKAVREAKRKLK